MGGFGLGPWGKGHHHRHRLSNRDMGSDRLCACSCPDNAIQAMVGHADGSCVAGAGSGSASIAGEEAGLEGWCRLTSGPDLSQ